MMDSKQSSDADGSALRFRAIMARGSRRGIRLEDLFWKTLEELASSEGKRLGDLIAEYGEKSGDGNVTAALRFAALKHLRNRVQDSAGRGGANAVVGLIAGCPTPAFALSQGRKILAYNQPFLTFLQARLSHLPSDALAAGLRLQLDTPFDALIDRLKADPQTPIPAGYSIATRDKLVRGRLSAVLAPAMTEDAIIGYIVS